MTGKESYIWLRFLIWSKLLGLVQYIRVNIPFL